MAQRAEKRVTLDHAHIRVQVSRGYPYRSADAPDNAVLGFHAGDGHRQRQALAIALDLHADFLARTRADKLHPATPVIDWHVIGGDDQVTGFQPRLLRRPPGRDFVEQRRDQREPAIESKTTEQQGWIAQFVLAPAHIDAQATRVAIRTDHAHRYVT